MVVVDASAVIKWFLPEQDSQTSRLLLRGGTQLVAPSCVLSEVAHVLLKKERRGEAETMLACTAAGWLTGSRMIFLADRDFIVGAASLAYLYRHAVFDCLYLQIARERGLPLATFDRPMAALATRLSIPLWSPDTAA